MDMKNQGTVKPNAAAEAIMAKNAKVKAEWEDANNSVRLMFNAWAELNEEDKREAGRIFKGLA